jgi:hypothetical protein
MKFFSCLRKFFIDWTQAFIYLCDYMNDCYVMILTDTWSIGLDRPCLGKMDCTTP